MMWVWLTLVGISVILCIQGVWTHSNKMCQMGLAVAMASVVAAALA